MSYNRKNRKTDMEKKDLKMYSTQMNTFAKLDLKSEVFA